MTGSPLSPSGATAWRLNPLVQLRWKVWGDGCVAFEAVSGETDTVDAVDAAVLSCCGPQPQSLTDITRALVADLGIEGSDALHTQVADALAGFAARGWLEVHTPAA